MVSVSIKLEGRVHCIAGLSTILFMVGQLIELVLPAAYCLLLLILLHEEFTLRIKLVYYRDDLCL